MPFKVFVPEVSFLSVPRMLQTSLKNFFDW
jgi:hypothetical protein